MLVRDIFVLELSGFGVGFVEEIAKRGAELLLCDTGDFREASEGEIDFSRESLGRRTEALKKRAHDAVRLRHKSGQKMQRLDLLMIVAGGYLLSFLESFLSFDGEFVETEH
jgi:hypothetical protein